MSNPWPGAACGPVEGFVRLILGFPCSKNIVHTDNYPYFDNLKFDIFHACGPQCHFITCVTIAVRIRTLSGVLAKFSFLGSKFAIQCAGLINVIQCAVLFMIVT